jgi:hypothetical protein
MERIPKNKALAIMHLLVFCIVTLDRGFEE